MVGSLILDNIDGPHGRAEIHTAGRPLANARAAMIMAHGRGASADDMLGLAAEFHAPEVAVLAPQAVGHTWYPYRFMAPLAQNEPHLSSALALLNALVRHATTEGVPAERVMLLGFSQGACLTLEYAARHARRYGGVVALTGGLIGPDGHTWDFQGSLDGTPVFIGSSDQDPHIPLSRLTESAAEFERLGGSVDFRLYPDLGHAVNPDEIDRVQSMLDSLT